MKPEIKYHPDSGLLMVRGEESQIEIVQQVLSELGAGSSVEKPAPDTEELRSSLKRLEDEVAKLRSEVAGLKGEGRKSGKPSNEEQ